MQIRSVWVVFAGVSCLIAGCARHQETPTQRTFVILQSDDILTTRPNQTMELATESLLSNVYDGLVKLDPDLKLMPALAESWENPDQLTWRFHLRHGVRFHNGRELEAADVQATLDGLRKDSSGEFSTVLKAISTVTAADRYTVDIRTSTPRRLLNDLVYIQIIPRDWKNDNDTNPPPGTGPYQIVEWRRGERIHAEAAAGCWSGDPAIKSVILLPVRDGRDRVDMLRRSRADLVADLPYGSIADITSAGKVRILTRRGLMVAFLVLDTTRERSPGVSGPNPFRDARVRQAISLALDRAAIVETAMHGYASEATQFLAPDVFGYDERIKNPPKDVEAARKLLHDAGFDAGFKVVLTGRDHRREVAEMIRDQLKPLGITVELQLVGGRDFQASIVGGKCTMALMGWACDTGDGENLFEYCIRSRDGSKGSWLGEMGQYSNPEIEAMLQALSTTVDQRERLDLLTRIGGLMLRELPWIPIYVEHQTYAVSQDYAYSPRADGEISLKNIRPLHPE